MSSPGRSAPTGCPIVNIYIHATLDRLSRLYTHTHIHLHKCIQQRLMQIRGHEFGSELGRIWREKGEERNGMIIL